MLSSATLAEANSALFLLFFTYDEHVGDVLQLGVANLAAYLLAAVVNGGADAYCIEVSLEFLGVLLILLADGKDSDLVGREPEGEVA